MAGEAGSASAEWNGIGLANGGGWAVAVTAGLELARLATTEAPWAEQHLSATHCIRS